MSREHIDKFGGLEKYLIYLEKIYQEGYDSKSDLCPYTLNGTVHNKDRRIYWLNGHKDAKEDNYRR